MTLDDLRALEAAATPGPWAQQDSWPGHVVPQAHARRPWGFAADPEVQKRDYAQVIATVIKPETNSADAALIAAARNALPALLAIGETAQRVTELHRMGAGGDSWWEAIERLCEAVEGCYHAEDR